MKKIVLTYGLISGAISIALMMVVTMPSVDRIGFGRAEILGYTTIVLSLLLVYAGVRSYRDNVAGGAITFKRAFGVGLLITVISCCCYVVTWEILFFNLSSMQQFMDNYAAYIVDQAKASGASPEEIQARVQEMGRFKELYKNPLFNAAMTFTEPFPVGLIISLISAAILRKKNHDRMTVEGTVVS
jgi:hypothetical protein